MKFPYLRQLGAADGWFRVGPLARVNVCDFIDTPEAELARRDFLAVSGGRPSNVTMAYHWARMIELLHAAEVIAGLLHDADLQGEDLVAPAGSRREEFVAMLEAPRGTLTHHYRVDDNDQVTMANLIVSTTCNNEAMNRAVGRIAEQKLSGAAGDHRGPAQQHRGRNPRLRPLPFVRDACARADAARGDAGRSRRERNRSPGEAGVSGPRRSFSPGAILAGATTASARPSPTSIDALRLAASGGGVELPAPGRRRRSTGRLRPGAVRRRGPLLATSPSGSGASSRRPAASASPATASLPGDLLALGRDLFGAEPEAWLMGIRGYDFDRVRRGPLPRRAGQPRWRRRLRARRLRRTRGRRALPLPATLNRQHEDDHVRQETR